MVLCLEQELQPFVGPHFAAHSEQNIDFVHPITGQTHTLTVLSCTPKHLPNSHFNDTNYKYPCHFQQLTYTLEPDLEEGSFPMRDCDLGDSPKLIDQESNEFLPTSCIGVAIIGGVSGVTMISSAENKQLSKQVHTTCSALHFEPINEAE